MNLKLKLFFFLFSVRGDISSMWAYVLLRRMLRNGNSRVSDVSWPHRSKGSGDEGLIPFRFLSTFKNSSSTPRSRRRCDDSVSFVSKFVFRDKKLGRRVQHRNFLSTRRRDDAVALILPTTHTNVFIFHLLASKHTAYDSDGRRNVNQSKTKKPKKKRTKKKKIV